MTTGLDSLSAMWEALATEPEVVRPSRFWRHYAEHNHEQLDQEGFVRFKRTINENYFQWRVASRESPAFRAALRRFAAAPDPRVLLARLEDTDIAWLHEPQPALPEGDPGGTSPEARARVYALYVAMLWTIARGHEVPGLQEPPVGRPLTVRHRGRSISQDLAQSLLEARAILDALPSGHLDGALAIELGGGYGRLSWMLMQLVPGLRTVQVDIPPALAVAEEYARQVMPDRRLAAWAPAASGTELAARIAGKDLAFLTPGQLALLPDLGARLFVNVSSLHEMRPEQIAHYLQQADRHTAGHVYTKQWERSRNPHDGIEVRREDYPYPARWQRVFERRLALQPGFFEALLSTR